MVLLCMTFQFLPGFILLLNSNYTNVAKPFLSDQSKGDIVIKKFVETLIVVDKSVWNRFDNKSEAERFVKVLFSLVSQWKLV